MPSQDSTEHKTTPKSKENKLKKKITIITLSLFPYFPWIFLNKRKKKECDNLKYKRITFVRSMPTPIP